MFHRPNKSSTAGESSAASALKDSPTQAQSDVANEAPVMKSPASFLQSQQTLATKEDVAETTETKEEETQTMNATEEKKEATVDTAAQAVARGNYSTGSAYSAPSSFGAGTSTSSSYDRDTGRKLVVGKGINMSGEIDSCDHLIVEGTVEAALKGAEILDIYEDGTFFGTVEIQEATIAGKFEGDLVVHGRLTIRAGGEVSGNIAYGELSIEAGAIMQGMVRPTSALAAETAKPATAKKKTAKKLKAANTVAQEADTELPFAADAATA